MTQTLEFYDVPQIMTATDATGTRYLCTLFNDSANTYEYLGVQISEPRLMAFIGGQLDLRDAYLHPEVDNALYHVEVCHGELNAKKLLQPSEITDSMLPEQGYFYDSSDLQDTVEPGIDIYQLEVPAHDRMTFSTLISRMGWIASSIKKNIGKIASL